MQPINPAKSAAVLAVLCACGVCSAAGAPTITLKPDAVVRGEAITLADVAALPDETLERLRKLELGNAPWPGHRRHVGRALVQMRMAAQGFRPERYRFAGAGQCTVAAAAERITAERLLKAARGFLRDRYPGDAEVTVTCVDEPEPALVEADTEEIQIQARIQSRRRARGEVTVGLGIVRREKQLDRASCRFRVSLRKKVVVAAERIPRGTSPGADVLRLGTRDVAQVSGTPLTSIRRAEDAETVRSIPAGTVVTRDMVRTQQSPIVIRANDRVRLVVQGGGLRVSTVGWALSTARKGESVTAENAKTGRRVSGVADGDGRIVINMRGDEQ